MKRLLRKRFPQAAACVALTWAMAGVLACVQPIQRVGGITPAPAGDPTPAVGTPTPARSTPLPPTPVPPSPTATPVPQPLLEIHGPVNGSTLRGRAVVVHGLTSPGSSIGVNGQPAQVDGEGRFLAELLLPEGVHRITVAALDSFGNLKTQIVSVTLEPPQSFFLAVTEPSTQTVVFTRNVRLVGKTGPGALVSVNGVSISVDGQGSFTTTITLEPGPNIIDVLSTSLDGQVLSTTLAIIYRA